MAMRTPVHLQFAAPSVSVLAAPEVPGSPLRACRFLAPHIHSGLKTLILGPRADVRDPQDAGKRECRRLDQVRGGAGHSGCRVASLHGSVRQTVDAEGMNIPLKSPDYLVAPLRPAPAAPRSVTAPTD
jgi:hypothetical protein